VSFRFQDRAEAGRFLADKLQAYAGRAGVFVLGLPRGGIPIAYEVARKLQAPLQGFLVRKLGVPGHEELAMGAIASGGVCCWNEDVLEKFGIPPESVQAVVERERRELARLERACRIGPLPDLRGHVVILADDGLATGATMRAAVKAVREFGPARIVAAAPVSARDTCRELEQEVDEIVCGQTPWHFSGVGQWYRDFSPTTDEEVRELLKLGAAIHPVIPCGP
jgi:predicted phosphoribosyltransferase